MKNDPLLGAGAAWALDAYLNGSLPAPARNSSAFAPLHRAVALSTPTRPHRRDLARFYDDPGFLAACRSAFDISVRVQGAGSKERRQVETIARIQLSALLSELSRREKEVARLTAFEIEGLEREIRLLDGIRTLAGVVALTLAETGVSQGQDYVRGYVQYLLQGRGPDAPRYAAAALGVMAVETVGSWHAGGPPVRWLSTVLGAGHSLLDEAWPDARLAEALVKAGARKKDAEPTPEPVSDGPSLQVLTTVQHLPGSAEDGKGKPGGATMAQARGEWGPFAGRRWPLVAVPDLAAVRETLVAEFPYAEGVIDAILQDLAGRPHVWLRPILLVGPPGSGKTRLARRLAEVLGLAFQVYGCSGVADSSLIGTSRQWSTGRASIPLQLLKRVSAACAVMVLDEIDKAGTSTQNGALVDGILPFLSDPTRIFDPYLECEVDLSGVSWVATANDISGLRRTHPALVDRLRVYTVNAPRRAHLPALLPSVAAEIRAERGLDEAWCPDLLPDEVELVVRHYQGGSVRAVRRLVEAVLAGRELLAQRH